MPVTIKKTLRQLRNTRDLRAEMPSLAAALVPGKSRGGLTLVDPVINEATLQEEWERLLPAIAPHIRNRMAWLRRRIAMMAR